MEIFSAVWVESKPPFLVEVLCIYSLQKKEKQWPGWVGSNTRPVSPNNPSFLKPVLPARMQQMKLTCNTRCCYEDKKLCKMEVGKKAFQM